MTEMQPLDRRAAVKRILADRGDLLITSSLGGPSYDVAAATGAHPLDFPLGGAMGSACMVGLGLALSQPTRRVLVFVGDGEMLMSLSSLATIGAEGSGNIGVVVIDNEHYAETGMQRTHTGRGVDITAIAAACGFAETRTVRTEQELADAMPLLRQARGPVLVSLKVNNDIPPVFPRIRDGVWLKAEFRRNLLGRI